MSSLLMTMKLMLMMMMMRKEQVPTFWSDTAMAIPTVNYKSVEDKPFCTDVAFAHGTMSCVEWP